MEISLVSPTLASVYPNRQIYHFIQKLRIYCLSYFNLSFTEFYFEQFYFIFITEYRLLRPPPVYTSPFVHTSPLADESWAISGLI